MADELAKMQHWPDEFWIRAVLIQNLVGQITGISGDSNTLTDRIDRDHLIKLRNSADLVIVGANTIRAENPPAPTAIYWIISSTGKFDQLPRAFSSANTFIVSKQHHPQLPTKQLSQITASEVVSLAKAEGFKRILIEGGANLIQQFSQAELLDEAIITVVDRPGIGEVMHRSRLGLSLRYQVSLKELKFQSWLREGRK